ncbi:MAG: universal stress protein [Acidimicrobiaceae bacterium]|nr:universal stress protein [Acidimicrobiaceae bacterium]
MSRTCSPSSASPTGASSLHSPPNEQPNPDGRGADAETARRHADGLLESLQLSSSRPVSVHTILAEPHQAILDVAERTQADLIVIGNRGMVRNGRFTKAAPARVLRGATCSVLVVDTSDAAT